MILEVKKDNTCTFTVKYKYESKYKSPSKTEKKKDSKKWCFTFNYILFNNLLFEQCIYFNNSNHLIAIFYVTNFMLFGYCSLLYSRHGLPGGVLCLCGSHCTVDTVCLLSIVYGKANFS